MNLTPNAPSRFAAAGQTAWPAGSPNMSFKTADNGPARVGVARAQDAKRLRLLAALTALAVRFGPEAGNYEGLDAVTAGRNVCGRRQGHQAGKPLHLPLGESPGAEIARTEIHFADNDRSSAPPHHSERTGAGFRRRFSPRRVHGHSCLRNPAGPFWVARSTEGVRHDCSLLTLPPITGDEGLFEWLNAKRFVQVLPVIDFLRFLAREQYSPPPLRGACFMFDDPNLHFRCPTGASITANLPHA